MYISIDESTLRASGFDWQLSIAKELYVLPDGLFYAVFAATISTLTVLLGLVLIKTKCRREAPLDHGIKF